MSKNEETKVDSSAKDTDIAEMSKALIKKDNKITDLEQRLSRIEKRTKNNERFARTFATSLSTQVLAIDAVTDTMVRALRENATVHDELSLAIREYDKHKIRRWFSGFFGVLLWVASVTISAVVGAFIYWMFSGM